MTPERIFWFSIFVRSITLVARSESLRDSSSMMSVYSLRCSSVRFPLLRSFAKPAMETIGVLNSWEKLLTKSLLSISVLSSSSASVLKLFVIPFTV